MWKLQKNCGNMPRYGSTCNYCSKLHHWSTMCRQRSRVTQQSNYTTPQNNKPSNQDNTQDACCKHKRINEMMNTNDLNDHFDSLHFESLSVEFPSEKSWELIMNFCVLFCRSSEQQGFHISLRNSLRCINRETWSGPKSRAILIGRRE